MRTTILLVLIMLCSMFASAADKIVPPNVRLGLWEITENRDLTGMPAMPTIPPEVLARMTPEQRAQMEARMSGGPKTTIRKYCVTKEKLEKDLVFGDERNNDCKRTVLSSSSTMTEVKIQCTQKETTSNGTFKFEVLSPDNVKGTVRMVSTTGNGRTMNINLDFVSKYLGSACGDIK
jgi:hypothetical protein